MSGYMKDPNMQEAADKIVAILREHKIMGVVLIAGEARAGFIHELSPPWSCIKDEGGGAIRVKSKRSEYSSTEEQQSVLQNSIGGVMGILGNVKYVEETLTGLIMAIGSKVNINHVQSDPNIDNRQIGMD